MATTNHERDGKMLDFLTAGLCQFVERDGGNERLCKEAVWRQ